MKDILHLYICHHRRSFCFSDKVFKPIHVGKALTNHDIGIMGDDTGEHISHKNKEFCELTALYWAWKNDSYAQWIGLMHYRRFLDFSQKNNKPDVHGCVNFASLNENALGDLGLNADTVEHLIRNNPKIVAILPCLV